jgi:hypothetical protein
MKEWIAKLFSDWPEWTEFWNTVEFGRESKGWWLCGFLVLALAASWLYRRDTRELHAFWKVWLWSLRLLVLAALLLVALAPQERKSRVITRNSRAILLFDTSVSMSRQDRDLAASSGAAVPSRAELVRQVLENTKLLDTLRQTHDVTIATFDSTLARQVLLPKTEQPGTADGDVQTPAPAAPGGKRPAEKIDWEKVLRPRGVETRLGEALLQLIREEGDETLAGIAVYTDGGANAGVDPQSAAEAAVAAKVRVISIGVGSTRLPVSLQLSEIQSPTHVHIGDGFTLTAFVTGHGLAGQMVQVDLLGKPEEAEGEPEVILSKEEQLLEDGVPIAVPFNYVPSEAGRRIYRVRVSPVKKVAELAEAVVQDEVAVEVVDRKTKVLLIAGGPMRDYQFVRNLLHRDRTTEVDVLLQTGVVGISQESDNLLFQFPKSREELFAYDVIVAFDADWKKLAANNAELPAYLADWVFQQAGGLVLIAGDVYTPELAGASAEVRSELGKLFELYPVVLDTYIGIDDEESSQPWPVDFTREGLEAGFLHLTDDAASSANVWKEFPGVFRCFPTDGAKAGATVYARYSDPRAVTANDLPILIASQYYGAGRVLYLGSAEFWRLRGIDEDTYDRLWVKLLREVGQGRLLRGTNRGILLLERTQYPLGAGVQVRARVLDPQFKDFVAERVGLEVTDPSGKPVSPPVSLLADPTRPGQFAGSFIAGMPGSYKLELPIPESKDRLRGTISVKLPNLEFDHPEQNEPLLRAIARERAGGGKYLRLDEAAAQLPGLLPYHGTEKVQYDFPRTLWDRRWVMYVLVSLLGVEWLTRKLLKLA